MKFMKGVSKVGRKALQPTETTEGPKARGQRPPAFENARLGPRHLPEKVPGTTNATNGTVPGTSIARFRAAQKHLHADASLVAKLRKRLTKDKGTEIGEADAQYLVRTLKRADVIGERTLELLFHLLEHAQLPDPKLWSDVFDAVAAKADLPTSLPVDRVVAKVHELADALSEHQPLGEVEVTKLLALGTVRGIPSIRTRRALESVRKLRPMTKAAARLFATELSSIPLAPPKPWTFFVYMSSENNLEPWAVDDLNAMERTFAKIAPFANVVVLADGGVLCENDEDLGPAPAKNWVSSTRMLLIEPDEGPGDGAVISETVPVPEDTPLGALLSKHKGELNLGEADTLAAAVDFVQERLPSDHFFMNVWSHGLAWKGAAEDAQNGEDDSDMLAAKDIQQGLAKPRRKIDVMGFDACLMANSGVSLLLSKLGVDHLIGSEELLDATGWGYDNVFNGLAETFAKAEQLSPAALARTVVDVANATTISTVDLKGAERIWDKLDGLGAALLEAGGRTNPALQQIIEALPRYGSYGVDAEPDQAGDEDVVDIVHMCKTLEAGFGGEIAKAAKDLREATLAVTHHKNMASESYPGIEDRSYGLTTYLPRAGADFDPKYVGDGAVWKDAAPKWLALLAQDPDAKAKA